MKQVRVILVVAALLAAYAHGQSEGMHLFILSGQSNMGKLDPAESFTPMVEKEFGADNVIVVKDAQGGQPILRWYKNWVSASGEKPKSTGDLYDRLMTKVNAAIAGKKIQTITFVWMQGERDARSHQDAVYAASLKGLLDQLKTDLGRDDINVVIGRINDFDMTNPGWTMIRDIQVQFAESLPYGAWVDMDDLNSGETDTGVITNDIHCIPSAYRILGARFAEKAIALVHKRKGDTL